MTSSITSFDLKKAKLPMQLLGVPDQMLRYVGQVTVLWGQFENHLDRILGALIAENKTTLKHDWTRQNLRKRRMLFMDEVKKAFPTSQAIDALFRGILNEAAHLHVARNLLVHGSQRLRLTHQFVFMVMTGRHNGKTITINFDEKRLEALFYDVAHLAERLNTFRNPSSFHAPTLASSDRQLLRAFLERNLPPRPTEPTP